MKAALCNKGLHPAPTEKRKKTQRTTCRDCHLEYQRGMAKKYRNAAIDALREYKLESGCVMCGWNEHHAGLQFDHINPVGKDRPSRTPGRATCMSHVEEIVTDPNIWVLCATCHAIKSFEMGDSTTAVSP